MSEIVEQPRNRVLLETHSLSAGERSDLARFLETQPEIQQVQHVRFNPRSTKRHLRNIILDLPPYYTDLLVHFAEGIVQDLAAGLLVLKLSEWWKLFRSKRKKGQRKGNPRKARSRHVKPERMEQNSKNVELILSLAAKGHIVRVGIVRSEQDGSVIGIVKRQQD